MQQITDELVKNGPKSTKEIALAINYNITTVKNWIKIIEKAQSMPKIIVERAKNITLVHVGRKE